MEKIIITEYVLQRLDEILKVLIFKGYFSFEDSALTYIDNLVDFIYTIPQQKHRICKNSKHGFYYCRFKQNDNTTWFITFDKEKEIYLVKNIFNNHTSDYPDFIRSIN